MRSTWPAVGVGLMVFASVANAERLSTPPVTTATITDGEGHGRVLVPWTSPIQDESVAIRKAVLSFSLDGDVADRQLRIRVYPITRPWSPETVDWATGWSRPGGDFNEAIWSYATLNLRDEGRVVTLDVTNVVKEVIEEELLQHGFLITAEPSDGVGLNVADLDRFSRLDEGNLEVSWRKVPPAVDRGGAGIRIQSGVNSESVSD